MNDAGIRVPLEKVIEGIAMADNGWSQFLDIEAMEIVSLPDGEPMGEEEEEYRELSDQIEEGWKTRYFSLPDKFDLHEYGIIGRFVYDMPFGGLRDRFARAIQGRGAFRRFKDTLRYFDMEQEWFDYRDRAYRELAVAWCEVNGFGYVEEKEA